jgi:predicted  nucleic acid-binding Zn-ribbon protein
MSAALGLFRLQQVDSRLSQIDGQLERIRATLENDAELNAAREELRHAQVNQDESERARRAAEVEAHTQQTKIQQTESSLYGGSVRNPKELQELQADIAALRRHLSTLEEQELEAMLRQEVSEGALRQARGQLERVQIRVNEEHVKLIDEQRSLTRDRTALETERQATVSAVAAKLLNSYEDLRRLHRGVAVAEVFENSCDACGTTLTAALQQNARHAIELVYCPSCGRILYAG